MQFRNICFLNSLLIFVVLSLAFQVGVFAQNETIDFESERWNILAGRVEDYLGQKSFTGNAILKDVEFENGVIEVDVAFEGERCFAGIVFRWQDGLNYEQYYLRPHQSKHPDAMQYQPVFNGLATWQLYSNEGYTAVYEIPYKRWIHIKLEISGTQGRVFLDNAEEPALVINELKHGLKKGAIGVYGPANGLAHFSNFSFREDNDLYFDDPEKIATPYGMVTDWEISQSFRFGQLDIKNYPDDAILSSIEWKEVTSEPPGLINVGRYVKQNHYEPEAVFARTILESDKEEIREFNFGYSDAVVLFFNGKILFTGNSTYRVRDHRFLGTIGLFDAVHLPMKKGKNELMLLLLESFGGWGFMVQDGNAEYLHDSIEKTWETTEEFFFPESAIYDKKRDIVYITHYDMFLVNGRGDQFISKISVNGEIVEYKWAEGLNQPLGMTIYKERLFVAERRNIAEIDIESGEIVKRYLVPGAVFLNDIVMDGSGNMYVSDSRKNVIHRYTDGEFKIWLEGEDIEDPNVLFIHENRLLFGNSGDSYLKTVNLESGAISKLAKLDPGFIDGIKLHEDGWFLVSLWDGVLYKVTQDGDVQKLLDTTASPVKFADFEYIKEKNLIIVPTMNNGLVKAYKINMK